MNNKLIKKLLINSALITSALIGINNNVSAVVVTNNKETKSAGSNSAYEFQGNAALTLKVDGDSGGGNKGDPIDFAGILTIANDVGGKDQINTLEICDDARAGGAAADAKYKFSAQLARGNAGDAALDIKFTGAMSNEVTFDLGTDINVGGGAAAGQTPGLRDVDFSAGNSISTLTLKGISTLNSVKGSDGTKGIIIANDVNADVTISEDSDAKIFKTEANAGAKLTLNKKSKADQYIVSDGIMTIMGDSEAVNGDGYLVTAANSVLIFDSAAGAITAKGDLKFGDANAKLTFQNNAVAANDKTITFQDDMVSDAATGKGIIELKDGFAGRLVKVVLEGTVGTELLRLNKLTVGNFGDLTFKKDAYFTADSTIGGNGSIVTLDSKDAALSFNIGAVGGGAVTTLAGNGAADSTLFTKGANDVTINADLDNLTFLVGTDSTASTIMNGKIGAANLAIKYGKEGSKLELKGDVANNPTIDFDSKKGILELNSANVLKFGAISNVDGSNINIKTAKSVEFGIVNKSKSGNFNDNLSIKSDVAFANGLTVVTDSFFNDIDVAKGKLNFAGGNLSVANIRGATFDITAAATINALDSSLDVIDSAMVITSNQDVTINGDFKNFGSKFTAVDKSLSFTGNNIITAKDISLGNGALNIAAPSKTTILDTNFAFGGTSHKVDRLKSSGGTIKLASNYGLEAVTFANALDLGSSSLDLGKNVLYLTKDDSQINWADKATLIISDGGKIVGGKGFDAANANDVLNIVIEDDAKFESQIIMESDNAKVLGIAGVASKNINIKQNNDLIETSLTFSTDNRKASLGRTVNSDNLKSLFESSGVTGDLKSIEESILALDTSKFTSDAFALVNEVGNKKITSKDDSIKLLAGIETRDLVLSLSTAQVAANVAVESLLQSRMSAPGASDDLRASSALWARGSYGAGSQTISNDKSYDSSLFAGTIGGEFGVGETLTVGAAASYVKTTLEHKKLRDGDKDEINSFFGSLYAFSNLENNVVLNGSLTFGNSNIEGTSATVRNGSTTDDEKISSLSFGGSVLGGYKMNLSSLSITPLVGMKFGNFTNPEQKTPNRFGKVKETTTNRLDLTAGLSIGSDLNVSDMIISPELHGFVAYNIKGDDSQKVIDINGLPNGSIAYTSKDSQKTTFNVGGSLTAKSGMFEYGASVDGQFADQYWGVLGSLKLKVNL